MRRFEVRFVGGFFTYALLDEKGQEQYSLEDACTLAERMYGVDWKEVYNGETGISREEWRAQKG